jgi:hypothetical protein
MGYIIFLLLISNFILGYIAIKNTIYLKKIKEKTNKRINKVVPKLSNLHGKEFTSYMNELNKDL